MRKHILILVAVLTIVVGISIAYSESEWFSAPIFTKAYEQSSGKIYIEWEGSAPVYQIYLDGNKVADVIVNHYVLSLEKGTHSIIVYPVNETRDADTKISLNLQAEEVGGSISIDLASLGIDPKHLTAGTPSEALNIDYMPSQILQATPDQLSAATDPENRVILTFADPYSSDEYLIVIRHRNDANYLTIRCNNEADGKYITKTGSMVSLVMDPDLLREKECLIPELNEEYRFTVQLRKYGTNLITGEKESSVIAESKTSPEFKYKVTAAWKTAPVITFASQTADGQISLQWQHDDFGAGCQYAIMKINKILNVMTGEEQLGITDRRSYVIDDLTNGSYCINVVPILGDEKGSYSADVNVDISNEWVIAPELECEQNGSHEIRLFWKAPANIESYHITVLTGDNQSLLKYVDLDFSKYTEFDLPAVEGNMEYIYTYDKDIDPDNGEKIKFEIYGIRHTANGDEQHSSVSSKTIILK